MRRARFARAALVLAAVSLLSGCAWIAQVDVPVSGAEPNAIGFRYWLSPTGRYVFFDSGATNLVPGSSGQPGPHTGGVFLRDQRTGKTALVRADAALTEDPGVSRDLRFVLMRAPGYLVLDRSSNTTEPIAVATNGTPLDGSTTDATLSGDGRYIVFRQALPGGVLATFVRDREPGTTTLVTAFAPSPGNLWVAQLRDTLSLNRDGSVLAQTTCVASVLGRGNAPLCTSWRLHVWDLAPGTVESPLPDQPGRFQVRLDADGHQLAYSTGLHVWVLDRTTQTQQRIDIGASDEHPAQAPSISADGRYVAFTSSAPNLVPGVAVQPTSTHVYVHDRFRSTTMLASADVIGMPLGTFSIYPAISGNGRYVTFRTILAEIVPAPGVPIVRAYTKSTLIPHITSVVPASGMKGTVAHITISGDGFRPETRVQIGDGATVLASIVSFSETSLLVDVTIPPGAPAVAHDLFVYTPGNGPGFASGAGASCGTCFQVTD